MCGLCVIVGVVGSKTWLTALRAGAAILPGDGLCNAEFK